MTASESARYVELTAAHGPDTTRMDQDDLARLSESVAQGRSLSEIMDLLWRATGQLLTRDRISIAFVENDGQTVVSRCCHAGYEPLLLREGFRAGLAGSTLARVMDTGQARIISDLERYLREHPDSESTRRLYREGVRSSLTLPLAVHGRRVGFFFVSSRERDAYADEQAIAMLTLLVNISPAVEKAWIIKRLEDARHGYMEVLGFVAHEMKSPLANLVSWGESYTGGYHGQVDPKAAEVIERMIKNASYLSDMVGNYLNLSRLETGSMRFAPRPGVRLREDVLDFALDAVAVRAESRESRVTVTAPAGPVTLAADPDLLRIVLVNLLDNAVKYAPRKAEITVTLTVADGRLRLVVRNPGVGFTPEQAAGLFKRFSRLRQPGTEDRKGSGLGLYLAWWIVQRHGGRLQARSEPGTWAEFEMELPGVRDVPAS